MVARAIRTRAFGGDARARGRARARGAPCASRSSSATEAVTTPARRARRGAGARAGTARGAGRAPRRAPSVAAAGAATAAETAALHIAAVDRRGRGGACACAKSAPREAKRGGRSSAGGARERRGRGRGMAPVGEMARISSPVSWLNVGRWSRERDTVGSRIRGGGGRTGWAIPKSINFLILVCHYKLLQILFWRLVSHSSAPPGVRPRFENSGTDRFFLGAPRELQTLLPDRSFVISLPLPRASDFRTANRSRRGTRCATLPRSRDRGSSLRARRRSRPPARDGRLHPVARFFITPGEPTNKPSSRPPPAAGADARLPPPRSRQDRKMAQTPTFKLILVGDGGTGTRERPRPRRTPRARRPRGRAVFSRSDRRRLLRERLEALAVAAPRSRRSPRRIPPPSRSQARPRSSSAT